MRSHTTSTIKLAMAGTYTDFLHSQLIDSIYVHSKNVVGRH